MKILYTIVENAKIAIGREIARGIPKKGNIAFGSGTTVNAVIKAVSERKEEFQDVQFLSGSSLTSIKLSEYGIPEVSIHSVSKVDLVIDGADQVANDGLILKGRGGALLREKILWELSDSVVVGITEDKLVDQISSSVPVEIDPFAIPLVRKRLESGSINYALRIHPTGIPFYSDGGNYIIDVSDYENAKTVLKLTLVPGVIETGLFVGYKPKYFIHTSKGIIQR